MRHVNRVLSNVVVAIGMLYSIPASSQTAEKADRLVHAWRQNVEDPVRLRAIDIGGRGIEKDVRFSASDDWLSHLQLLLENDSSKEIVAIQLGLGFPDTTSDDKPISGMSVQLGQVPMYVKRLHKIPDTLPDNHEVLSIKPNEKRVVRIGDYGDDLTRVLKERGGSSTPSVCWITLATVYFADGTRWSGGAYSTPNQAAPNGYLRVTREEFLKYQPAK